MTTEHHVVVNALCLTKACLSSIGPLLDVVRDADSTFVGLSEEKYALRGWAAKSAAKLLREAADMLEGIE